MVKGAAASLILTVLMDPAWDEEQMKPEPNRLKTLTNHKPNQAMYWYIQAFQKYAQFNGRSRRSEYWYFVLINALVITGIILFELLLGSFGILSAIYSLSVIIPALAVTVRRLHDTGRSGWTILLGLIPVIGGILLLIFLLQDSQPRKNQYGAWVKEGGEGR